MKDGSSEHKIPVYVTTIKADVQPCGGQRAAGRSAAVWETWSLRGRRFFHHIKDGAKGRSQGSTAPSQERTAGKPCTATRDQKRPAELKPNDRSKESGSELNRGWPRLIDWLFVITQRHHIKKKANRSEQKNYYKKLQNTIQHIINILGDHVICQQVCFSLENVNLYWIHSKLNNC